MLHPDFLRLPIAHRGLHDAALGLPENSLAAILKAVEGGYGIELDVQLSADGRAIVFHDDTLDRMTAKTGPLRLMAAEALGRVRLAASDERIPTLSDVLDAVRGRAPLLIELKDQSGGKGAAPDTLERAVAADLKGYVGPVAVMSFNPHMMVAMRRLAPAIPRGITTCAYAAEQWPGKIEADLKGLRDIEMFEATESCFISHDWHDLSRPRVAELQARGVPILCWTVKSSEDEVVARQVAVNITFERYAAAIPAD